MPPNNRKVWQSAFPPLKPDDHKYDRGYLLIVAGQLPGAVKLAAYAARRMGAGIVKVVAHESLKPLMADISAGTVLEFYFTFNTLKKHLADPRIDAYLFGPGVTSLDAETQDSVFTILQTKKPCVLDAGALTAFEKNHDSLHENLHEKVVVTPHEEEFRRAFGWWKDRQESVKRLAGQLPPVFVLKGRQTLIAQGKKILTNPAAPATLATAGTGDVLAGFIAALLARGMPPLEAAAAAVHLHSQCAASYGVGLIAEDMADELPQHLESLG